MRNGPPLGRAAASGTAEAMHRMRALSLMAARIGQACWRAGTKPGARPAIRTFPNVERQSAITEPGRCAPARLKGN